MDDELEGIIRLNLRDFLEQQKGFTLDRAESSENSFKLRRGGEILIVHMSEGAEEWGSQGVWGYKNVLDPDDKGTIVDYLQNRNGGRANFSLGHVKKRVRGHAVMSPKPLRGSFVPGMPHPVGIRAPRNLSLVAERWNEARGVWGLPHYLESRGITAQTVAAYASALRMDRKGNVLFGHTNQNGEIVGYEIVGPEFKGFAKGGVRLLCRLGPVEGVEPVKIALTESGVDALSLAQLVGRRDALFCSTGGALSAHTVSQVERLAGKYPAAEILLGFDNDEEGEAFAAKIEKALTGRGSVRRLVPKAKDWNEQLTQAAKLRQQTL
jgi:hypothetical protein